MGNVGIDIKCIRIHAYSCRALNFTIVTIQYVLSFQIHYHIQLNPEISSSQGKRKIVRNRGNSKVIEGKFRGKWFFV